MKPRVLFVSGREASYMRNRVILSALRMEFDVAVVSGKMPTTVGRTIAGLAHFVASRPKYDLGFVGFYGQPLAVALSRIQRKPLILDAYVSTFDTLCQDRRWFRPQSPIGRIAFWLDQQACRVSARVVTDTQAHAEYFAEIFRVPHSKLMSVYVGCDQQLFTPRPETSIRSGGFEVFYYGAFLPLHGTEIIVQAAHLLRHRPDIHFTIGGDGPRRTAVEQMVTDLALDTVDLVGWIPLAGLPGYIARASLCLGGHFSKVPKAARVISTKTYQFLAMRKAAVVGDNPATRELLSHGKHAWMVTMGDPAALAEAIERLVNDTALRDQIAAGGYDLFRQRLSTPAIATQLASAIQEVLCTSVL
jgi:glycosyltransferase involved in cell wall biosynthesis